MSFLNRHGHKKISLFLFFKVQLYFIFLIQKTIIKTDNLSYLRQLIQEGEKYLQPKIALKKIMHPNQ